MALLLAQRVILGKMEFKDVPESLKPQVYEHLKDSGVEYLARIINHQLSRLKEKRKSSLLKISRAKIS